MRRIIKNITDPILRRELEAIWERLNLVETKTVEPTVSNLAPGAMAVFDGVLYVNDRNTIRKVTADVADAAYLKADGTVALTGNMSVDSGVMVDGVDIGGHAANASAHHAKYTDAEAVTAAKTVKLDDFATPDDNTDLNASIISHGLCPKAPNDSTMVLSGLGTWILNTSNTPVEVPTAVDDDGIANQWSFDANYLYLCIATNSWKRIAYDTWLSPGVGYVGQPIGLLLALTYA